jgi:hypothetical protein
MLEQLSRSRQGGSQSLSGQPAPPVSWFSSPLPAPSLKWPWERETRSPGAVPDVSPSESDTTGNAADAEDSTFAGHLRRLLSRAQGLPEETMPAQQPDSPADWEAAMASDLEQRGDSPEPSRIGSAPPERAAPSGKESTSGRPSQAPGMESTSQQMKPLSLKTQRGEAQPSSLQQDRGAENESSEGVRLAETIRKPSDAHAQSSEAPRPGAAAPDEPDLTSRLLEAFGIPLQLGEDGLPRATAVALEDRANNNGTASLAGSCVGFTG